MYLLLVLACLYNIARLPVLAEPEVISQDAETSQSVVDVCALTVEKLPTV